ncbi:MAG: hypothetical protein JST_000304 [Candidatus Parcubacteria bacterium]|nr:MAG: hypothetical protein JST_2760 [Candidatus Parcubacteria bacterium]
MKKFSLFLILTLISLSSTFSQKNFSQIFNETVELNENRFKDVNIIQPGDTVLLPARSGMGVEAWITDWPIQNNHDCMWKIAERYWSSEIPTFPIDTVTVTLPSPAPEVVKEKGLLIWVLLSLLILFIAAFVTMLITLWKKRVYRNPVIPGGLSNNAGIAANQIQSVSPSATLSKVERGKIMGEGKKKVSVMFSDGLKTISLSPGLSAYRATEVNGNISYYLQHCGNLTGVFADGRFSLPEGWYFYPDVKSNHNDTTVWESTANVFSEKKESPESPASVSDTKVNLESSVPGEKPDSDIVAAIKAIGELKSPVTRMTANDGRLNITVEFDQKK